MMVEIVLNKARFSGRVRDKLIAQNETGQRSIFIAAKDVQLTFLFTAIMAGCALYPGSPLTLLPVQRSPTA